MQFILLRILAWLAFQGPTAIPNEIMDLIKTVGSFGTFAAVVVYMVLNSKALAAKKSSNGDMLKVPKGCPLTPEGLVDWQENFAKTIAANITSALSPGQTKISELLAIVTNKQEVKERMLTEIEHQQRDVVERSLDDIGKVLTRIVENQSNFLGKMNTSQERIVELLIRMEERQEISSKREPA